MPLVSKYSNQQIEDLIQQMLAVLNQHKAPVDLSLLAIGNLATHLIVERIPVAQQESIANSFATALLQSIKQSKLSH